MFGTGMPMLTYHKLGPRPAGVRLKGLYVSRGLFERQLGELKRAGFKTAGHERPAHEAGNPDKRVALTFDDGFANVLQNGIEALRRSEFRAIEFLVAGLLGGTNEWEIREGEARERLMDEAQVKEWLAAGHEIGSHTLTHPYLSRVSCEQAREEIAASKKKLEDSFGVAVRHFCYPYGDFTPAVRDMVGEAGYATACTTEFGVNTATTPRLELRRITARYQSVSFKALKTRLAGLMRG
jgi:peptidoglycan/xylan/chitin deacetylase (PgdA/CDA1 family)